MSNLIAVADGSIQAANAFALVSTQSNSALLTTNITVNTTTSVVVQSVTMTLSVSDTLDGVLLHCAKNSGATGTVTVTLYSDNGITALRTVTVNATDLPSNLSWVFFKFGSTLVGNGLTTNRIGVSSSVNASAVFSAGSTTNWCRLVRKTALATAGSGDDVFIVGELTGAGTSNTRNMTMVNTSATPFVNNVDIGHLGTLAWGTAPSTNYIWNNNNPITIWGNGTYTIGTSAAPLPASSTATYKPNSTSNPAFTVKNGGTIITYGSTKTNWGLLNSTSSPGATSSTLTATPSGWLTGDVIALASTSRVNTEAENKSLTGTPSSAVISHTALTSAHSATGEVANLTKNIVFGGLSLVAWLNLTFEAGANVSFNNTALNLLPLTGLAIPVTAAFTANNCVFDYTLGSAANTVVGVVVNSGVSNVNISNSVFYNHGGGAIVVAGAAAGSLTLNNNLVIQKSTSVNPAISLATHNLTFTNNRATSSASHGINFSGTDSFGTVSNIIAHSNASDGIRFSGTATSGTLSSITVWNNGVNGLNFTNQQCTLNFTTGNAFGNAASNINVSGTLFNCIFTSWDVNAGTTLTCPIGLRMSAGSLVESVFNSCTFGTTTSHSVADVSVLSSSNCVASNSGFDNSILASSTEVLGQDNLAQYSTLFSHNHDQTTGNHRTFSSETTVRNDNTIYKTDSPSIRGTPRTTVRKSKQKVIKVGVAAGKTATGSVYVRKSVSGDGAAYNGAQPRLIVLTNPSAGILTDTVLATATGTSDGAFALLSGTTSAVTNDTVLIFVVDYDGTVGWVNLDDAIATVSS
jgi:hypothetical protein